MIPTRFRTHGAWKKAATQQGARRFDGDAMFDVAHAPDGNVMGEWNGSNGIGWVSGHFVGQPKASRRLLRAGIPDGSVGYPNPTTTDEKLRIAIGRLGDMAIGEWDGETGTVRELALVPGRDVKHNPAYRGRLSPRVLGLLRDAMIAATPHVDNLVGIITNDPRVKDKAMRLRWDMLWTGQRLARNDAMREVYAEGANDEHIDTALRQIARELNVPWQGATGNPAEDEA